MLTNFFYSVLFPLFSVNHNTLHKVVIISSAYCIYLYIGKYQYFEQEVTQQVTERDSNKENITYKMWGTQ